ncbi:hypothetical protein GCM10020219_005000 [Nonomuraea dietziae]
MPAAGGDGSNRELNDLDPSSARKCGRGGADSDSHQPRCRVRARVPLLAAQRRATVLAMAIRHGSHDHTVQLGRRGHGRWLAFGPTGLDGRRLSARL